MSTRLKRKIIPQPRLPVLRHIDRLRHSSHKRGPVHLVRVKLIWCIDCKRRPIRCRICRRAGGRIRGRAIGDTGGDRGIVFCDEVALDGYLASVFLHQSCLVEERDSKGGNFVC